MTREIADRLRSQGILPSAQRVAIARFVLSTNTHPCAEDVFQRVRADMPMVSLATVYNTLHLFAKHGLLRELALAEGKVVFDCRIDPHHHIVDEDSGAIHDLPWSAVRVDRAEAAGRELGFEISDYQVVLRGRRSAARAAKGKPKAR